METAGKKVTKKRTFVRRLEELNGEELREMMIVLPRSLHAKMKATASDRGIILREAYHEAAQAWIDAREPAAEHRKGSLEARSLMADIFTLFSKRTSHALAETTIQSVKMLVRSALRAIQE